MVSIAACELLYLSNTESMEVSLDTAPHPDKIAERAGVRSSGESSGDDLEYTPDLGNRELG